MFCPKCGNEVEHDLMFCPACGEKLHHDSVGKRKNPRKKSSGINPLIIIIPLIIVVVLVVVAGIFLLRGGIVGGKGTSDCLIWTDGSDFEFVKNTNTKEYEPIYLDSLNDSYNDIYTKYGEFSPDGKYFYYFSKMESEETGTLYRAEVSRIKKNNDDKKYQIRIDSDVYVHSFKIFEDGTLFYNKMDDDIQNIYYFNGTDSILIARDISYGYLLDKEVVYARVQEDGTYALYYKSIEEDTEPKKFVEGINNEFVIDADHIICSGNLNEETETEDLYIVGKDKKPTMIASDVYNWNAVKNLSDKSGGVYYEVAQSNLINLADAVTYSGYGEDKNTKEPDTNNPLYYNKNDGWWGSYTDAYYDAMDNYQAAQNRLDVIEELKEETYDLKTRSLYLYDMETGESTKLCGNMTGFSYTTDNHSSAVCYMKGVSEVHPVDITNIISEGYSVSKEYAENALANACVDRSAIYFRIGNGKEQKFELNDESQYENITALNLVLFNNGNKIAYNGSGATPEGKNVYTNVYVADIKDNTIGDFSSVSYTAKSIYNYGDELFAADDSDIYLYGKDGMKIFSESDTYVLKCYADGTIYNIEMDNEDYSGTLYKFDRDGERTRLLDNVTAYCVLNNNNIIYLSDGSLMKYDGKNSVVISHDVYCFWAANEKEMQGVSSDFEF